MVPDTEAGRTVAVGARPIFVLGILPRCGTNFLSDLLCLHPDCGPPEPIWEDFLLEHADLLARYADEVAARWNPRWGVSDATRAELLAHLGGGLSSFLTARCAAARVVTKTPRVKNLEIFFDLLPGAPLLVLVRDGRAVVESGVRTFGWNREYATHQWAEAAGRILRFDRANRDRNLPYRIVRYEDLCADLEREMRAVLACVGLDDTRYDFEAAAKLPVRGSSTIRERGDEVHWRPVERPPDFDPASRFRDWGRGRHDRFNWIAGRALEALGYAPQHVASGRLARTIWNVVLDAKWQAMRLIAPLYLKLKRRRGSGPKTQVS